MTEPIEVLVNLRLSSLQNMRYHWSVRARAAKLHRETTQWALKKEALMVGTTGPLKITITRIAPRTLDTDNLAISAKFVRDGVADWLRRNDGDPLIDWQYRQEKATYYAARIRIEA